MRKTNSNQPKLLTIKEVAERLRVSERSIFRYINNKNPRKKLKATKIGYWRISESDLEKFIKSNSN